MGTQIPTGPGPAKIVASPSGHRMATANVGPERSSTTILEQDRKGEWSLRNFVTPASGGIVFAGEKSLWISEGEGGKVRLMDIETGSRRKAVDLDQGAVHGSFSGDLAFDALRGLLFVADQAHDRMVVFETHTDQQVGEIATGSKLRAIGLGPDGKRAYALASNSLAVIDVAEAASPKIMKAIPLDDTSGLLATSRAIFVSHSHDDSIDVIDPSSNAVRLTVPLRIPGLESLRGIQPLGMAYDESRHWLLVAESGLNAVGVIDMSGSIKGEVLGHLPVGWLPTSLLYLNGTVVAANAKGRGTGPSSVWLQPDALEFEGVFRRGSISRFPVPAAAAELAHPTRLVLALNGLLEVAERPHPHVPVRHVVVVLKGSRTFDDILGDMKLPGSPIAGSPPLARFGNEGYADGRRKRLSLQQIPVTPNHHALGQQFTFSDNFYADRDDTSDGLSKHLEQHHVSFLDFGEAFDSSISDQSRVSRLIRELEEKYKNPGLPLPQLTLIHLPNDKTALPRPQDGYPYSASYAADNDFALGRIVDYLSHSAWWRDTAIFVTEADAQDGRDHVDSHRTIFLGIGPWFRRGYCSHVNADFAAVLKSTFRLLGVPPLNLSDAAAADLGDMFTEQPDYTPYIAQPVDPRLFDAGRQIKSP